MNIQEVYQLIRLLLILIVIVYIIIISPKIIDILKEFVTTHNKINTDKLVLDYFLNKDENDYSLDLFIIEYFELYVLSNSLETKEYIKEKERDEMIKKISKEIINRMSKSLYIYISYVYNEKKILEIIIQKVTLLVTKYIIEHNMIE